MQLNSLPGVGKATMWHQFVSDIAYMFCNSNSNYSFIAGTEQIYVWIHHVGRRHSQAPFEKIKGSIQLVQFHPSKPIFFVAVSGVTYTLFSSDQKIVIYFPISRRKYMSECMTW